MDIGIISVILGLFVGFVLGLTGAGGSILAVPLLVFALDLNLAQAIPIGLFAVMLASFVGALQGLFFGIVRYKAALLMASCGVLLAPLGAWLAHHTSNQILSLIFSGVLTYVAVRMWRQTEQDFLVEEEKPAPSCAVNSATSKLFWTASCTKRLMATGGIAGLLSGLLGVGGGFVIVPSLRKVSNLEMCSIVATSLAVIALVSMTSVVFHAMQQAIDWEIALPFTTATLLGMLFGRSLSQKISNKALQRAFSGLAMFIALALFLKAL